MQIQVKSSHGITLVPLETKLLDERKVFIEGVITQESACEFTKKIMYLNAIDPDSPNALSVQREGKFPQGCRCMMSSSRVMLRSGLTVLERLIVWERFYLHPEYMDGISCRTAR